MILKEYTFILNQKKEIGFRQSESSEQFKCK